MVRRQRGEEAVWRTCYEAEEWPTSSPPVLDRSPLIQTRKFESDYLFFQRFASQDFVIQEFTTQHITITQLTTTMKLIVTFLAALCVSTAQAYSPPSDQADGGYMVDSFVFINAFYFHSSLL